MSGVVYLLCAAMALSCAILLLRAYQGNRMGLLLWSGLCFAGLALDNVFLFADLIVFAQVDLSGWRNLPALVGLSLLLFGLVWDAE